MLKNKTYNADITAGSLLLSETKAVAGLLIDGKSFKEISSLVNKENILQKRSSASSTRIYSLIKHRLELFDKDLWSLIYYGDSDTSRLAAMIATLKNSRILADFMLFVLKEKYQLFETEVSKQSWEKFIQDCKMKNPDMPDWSEKTVKKIGDCVFRILAETGYINSTKEGVLQKVYIPADIKNFLQSHNENHILKCMEVSL